MAGMRGGDRPPLEGLYPYLLATIMGYFAADLGILYFRPAMLPSGAPPAYTPAPVMDRMAGGGDYSAVTSRNLFNADGVIPQAISAQKQGEGENDNAPAVLSQLPLKLEGTIVHADPRRSVATVNVQASNETKAFMLDDEIAGVAKVKKIERRRLTFRNLSNNRLEFIEIPKDSAILFGLKNQESTAGGGDSEVAKVGEFDFTLRRDTLNDKLKSLTDILNQARMIPNIVPGTGGRVDGFKFVTIQPNSIYEKLGFKAGDSIKSVNGEPVNSPTKAMELYNALRSETRIRLGVERDGREETFTYEVKD